MICAGFSRFFCGSLFFRQSNSERDKQCTSWYRGQSAILMNQTACPPLYQQALQDWRFEQEPLNEIGVVCCVVTVVVNILVQ